MRIPASRPRPPSRMLPTGSTINTRQNTTKILPPSMKSQSNAPIDHHLAPSKAPFAASGASRTPRTKSRTRPDEIQNTGWWTSIPHRLRLSWPSSYVVSYNVSCADEFAIHLPPHCLVLRPRGVENHKYGCLFLYPHPCRNVRRLGTILVQRSRECEIAARRVAVKARRLCVETRHRPSFDFGFFAFVSLKVY